MGELWGTPLFKGLAGTLFSPSRGLFAWSPILIFSLLGLVLHLRKKGDAALLYGAAASALLIINFSLWYDWAGGNSWGYRVTLCVIPFLCLLVAPALDTVRRKKVLAVVFVILFAFSVSVQVVGYVSYDGASWEWRVREEDRYWSATDNQLAWELENFHFYRSALWQEISPIELEVEAVELVDLPGGTVAPVVTVDAAQVGAVKMWITRDEDPREPVSTLAADIPRGLNRLQMSPTERKGEESTLHVLFLDETEEQQGTSLEIDLGRL
jgi:uncharacterized membrane protein (UPF0136 family)